MRAGVNIDLYFHFLSVIFVDHAAYPMDTKALCVWARRVVSVAWRPPLL